MKQCFLRSWRVITVAVCLLGAGTRGTQAQTVNTWTNNVSGFWDETFNWSLGVRPDGTHALVSITNAATKTVTIDDFTTTNFPGSLTISNLLVSAPVGSTNTLLLDTLAHTNALHILNNATISSGGSLVISNSLLTMSGGIPAALRINGAMYFGSGGTIMSTGLSFGVNIGQGGIGSVRMEDGTWNANEMTLGKSGNSQGTFTQSGGALQLSSRIRVGEGPGSTGTWWMTGGQLFVQNDELLIPHEGVGRMIVSNGTWHSQAVSVGYLAGSQGTLTVAGGTNEFSGAFNVGHFLNSIGSVWVTGGQLTTTNFLTAVGRSGVGRFTVSNGTWRAQEVQVGRLAGSQGTLTVASGTNQLTSSLSLGGNTGASGTVWVTGGQLIVTNNETVVGANGVGQMAVSDGTWSAREVYVGKNAGSQGTLTVAGGTNQLMSFMSVGENPGATGTVWVTGGQLVLPNPETDVGWLGTGRMTVSNGTFRTPFLRLGANGGAQGDFIVAGGNSSVYSVLGIGNSDCTGVGSVLITGGILAVTNASSTAVLVIDNGTLTLNGGTLRADTIVSTNPCAQFVRTGGTLIYGTAVLNPGDDTDGDGIPNASDLDPFNPADAGADSDGDGQSNLAEYLAGTNPTNSASAFRITAITPVTNSLRVTWATVAGKTNALERTAGAAGSFTTNGFTTIFIATNTAAGTTNYVDLSALTNSPARYYRVRLVP